MKIHSSKTLAATAAALVLAGTAFAEPRARQINGKAPGLGNELINIIAFQRDAAEAVAHRKGRRVTESQFIEMAADKNTIILDTRSAGKFALLHVRGAKHLNFSDITTESLARVIPSKDTRVLIYCNNNFDGEPKAFPSKQPSAALNIPTYIALYSYGYKNVYELGPLLDVRKTRIALEGVKLAKND